jgi:PIN domain nuclease of toxin-antitoxin system
MEILLDTHVVVWWMLDSPQLSKKALEILRGSGHRILVSAGIAWELAIKVNAGKIQPPTLIAGLDGAMREQVFEELPVSLEHAVRAGLLPLHHRDPFDRLLVAQAQALNLPILSADRGLDEYDVRRVW